MRGIQPTLAGPGPGRDGSGRPWLIVLASSGPDTAVLQIEQRSGWVTLDTVAVPGPTGLWVGVVPSDWAPEAPRGLRALNIAGDLIWRT